MSRRREPYTVLVVVPGDEGRPSAEDRHDESKKSTLKSR